jgi:hypothetical protein
LLTHLYAFSLYENASFIIVSTDISKYKLFKRSNKAVCIYTYEF